ncbi:hypothetical protein EMIT0P74_70291 [Pseudomonas sp. IT-P74]|jgi:hypothetical protein|uniref:hypothetical protein n=1 Tax=Pseudomonas sp. IT-P74 TaxID=3026445 RepID=UPI0039DF7581
MNLQNDRVLTWVCQGVEVSFVGVVDGVLTWACQGVEASFSDAADVVLDLGLPESRPGAVVIHY